ncbi:hypothetical protein BGZ94_007198 [Podila epigama]|nr:hypothetical protein BGZ94_007198 [Podila epigama]
MSSQVTIDSVNSPPLIRHVHTPAAHSPPGHQSQQTLSFSNYSPRQIQACLDSTIMTYLQQQKQRPLNHQLPPLPHHHHHHHPHTQSQTLAKHRTPSSGKAPSGYPKSNLAIKDTATNLPSLFPSRTIRPPPPPASTAFPTSTTHLTAEPKHSGGAPISNNVQSKDQTRESVNTIEPRNNNVFAKDSIIAPFDHRRVVTNPMTSVMNLHHQKPPLPPPAYSSHVRHLHTTSAKSIDTNDDSDDDSEDFSDDFEEDEDEDEDEDDEEYDSEASDETDSDYDSESASESPLPRRVKEESAPPPVAATVTSTQMHSNGNSSSNGQEHLLQMSQPDSPKRDSNTIPDGTAHISHTINNCNSNTHPMTSSADSTTPQPTQPTPTPTPSDIKVAHGPSAGTMNRVHQEESTVVKSTSTASAPSVVDAAATTGGLQGDSSPKPKIPSPSNYNHNLITSQATQMRMVPYIDENEEDEDDEEEEDDDKVDEDDEEGEYSGSEDCGSSEDEQEKAVITTTWPPKGGVRDAVVEQEETDSEEEDDSEDDDYSYSEDDEDDDSEEDEDQDSYHYGARQPKGPYSSRSMYPHFRPARLDENLLQKRAIAKQVVRRSSLTALFGEASAQSERLKAQSAAATSNTSIIGQQQPQGAPISEMWPGSQVAMVGANGSTSSPFFGHGQGHGHGHGYGSGHGLGPRTAMGRLAPQALVAHDSFRPQRMDSGVEVKVSPPVHPLSLANSEAPQNKSSSHISIEQPPSRPTSGSQQSSIQILETNVRRLRIKSEGDIPEFEQDHDLQRGEQPSTSACTTLPTRPTLRSSISANTFPRAVGKRTGVKHVRWHHSLFPTEHVLRVKPSLPSLSTVASETLSRIEITRMSYKQQGRQELTSPVPISKSVNDSIPWWNPTRWLKGPVPVDKRHWKPDSSRESCAYCFAPFHRLTNPRHHCRKCGDIFCGKCASAEILMDAKNCVYVQQSQLARWSRRVDIQRHNLRVDTLPQLHPVRTAVESGFVAAGSAVGGGVGGIGGAENMGSLGLAAGANLGSGLADGSLGLRGSGGSGSGNGRRGSWQVGPAALKKSRLSIFGLFNGQGGLGDNNGTHSVPYAGSMSDSRRGSIDTSSSDFHSSPFLQAHNPSVGVAFATGRRSSSSSLMRNSTVSGASNFILNNGVGEGGVAPIAMSRRMSSGGVGEVCLARICVGCERELLKPTKRCTSIAKYYTMGASRSGYRGGPGYPPGPGGQFGGGYGHHQQPLHPHQPPQQQQQQQQHHHQRPQQNPPPAHQIQDREENYGGVSKQSTAVHEKHHTNGVRRHSPLGQASYVVSGDEVVQSPGRHGLGDNGHVAQAQGCGQGLPPLQGGQCRDWAVGPHGESRHRPVGGLTFQEPQPTFSCCGRELI